MVNFFKVNFMVKENIYIPMVIIMKVTGHIISEMEKVHFFGKKKIINIDSIKDNSLIIILMEMVYLLMSSSNRFQVNLKMDFLSKNLLIKIIKL